MTIIAPVKTGNSNTALWFDANEIELSLGDKVIVETARGIEFGIIVQETFEATEAFLKTLKSDLKPVLRNANKEDIDQQGKMAQKSSEAMEGFIELAAKHNPEMLPVRVEYLHDGKKAIFYFSAPKRQDFRELVRELGGRFHVRVDMHQINEREKAAMVGGIGCCGEEICCKRCGKFPNRTSIKMAKAQGLALNPENISGCCGKLLCCLAYEFDQYEEFNKRAPKIRGKVQTPEGPAVVSELSMPTETVLLKYGDPEKRVRVPLDSISKDKKLAQPGQNIRPNKIEKEAWEEALHQTNEEHLDSLYTSQVLDDQERLADGKVHVMPTIKRKDDEKNKKKNAKPRRSRTFKNGQKPRKRNKNRNNNNNQNQGYAASQATPRRRRSRVISSNSGPKPGQNSSGVIRKQHENN